MNKSKLDELLVAIGTGRPVSVADIKSLGAHIDTLGESVSRTALMAAAFAGRSDLIELLVECGAALDRGNQQGLTPLHEAAGMGRVDAVKMLLGLGANVEAETSFGDTPLMMSAAWGNSDVVRVLL